MGANFYLNFGRSRRFISILFYFLKLVTESVKNSKKLLWKILVLVWMKFFCGRLKCSLRHYLNTISCTFDVLHLNWISEWGFRLPWNGLFSTACWLPIISGKVERSCCAIKRPLWKGSSDVGCRRGRRRRTVQLGTVQLWTNNLEQFNLEQFNLSSSTWTVQLLDSWTLEQFNFLTVQLGTNSSTWNDRRRTVQFG